MDLREADDRLQISLVETAPPGAPIAEELHLRVRVSSAGFAGASESVWAGAGSFQQFLAELRELEQRRQGTARLEAAAAPDEFWLEFRSIDRAGHMAIFGRLRQLRYLSAASEAYHQAVDFGFEFCPSRLPAVLAAFEQMATDNGETI